MKKYKFNLIFGVASGVIFVLLIIFTNGWEDLIQQIGHLHINWVLTAGFSMLFYWVFEAKTLQSIIVSINKEYRFKEAFKVTMIGQYFNAITPFASGGQPMQLYALTKQKLDAGSSSSALMIKFIIYQTTLVLYSLILIIWKTTFFKNNMNNLFYLIGIGFTFNISVIILLVVFSKYRKLSQYLIITLSKVLNKIKLVKDIRKLEIRIHASLDQFYNNIQTIKNNRGVIFRAVIYTTLQLTVFFMIPYFIYLSFGMKGASLSNMIAGTTFVIMITSFIPLPGSVGGAEGAFYIFFSLFFAPNNILSAILLWRLITFYSSIFFGFYTVIRNQRDIFDSQTYII